MKTIKVVFPLQSLKKYYQEQNISLLRIIVSESSHKRRLFGCAMLIQDNKKRTFSLSHSKKHYPSIYKENYPDGDLKGETFALAWGSLRI